jgi:hypothetical protein
VSGTPDMVFDEPHATGWLRAEFFGDPDLAKEYLGDARKQLGAMRTRYGVNARIANGEPGGFYRDFKVLPDGAQIETLTNDGQDTVRITLPTETASMSTSAEPIHTEATADAPIPQPEFPSIDLPEKKAEPEPQVREYCVLGPDSAQYADPIPVRHAWGPLVGATGSVYLVAHLDGDYVGPSFAQTSQIVRFDQNAPNGLPQNGTTALNVFPFNNGFGGMSYDDFTGRFYMQYVQAAASTADTKYGLVEWSDDVGSNTIQLDSYDGTNPTQYNVVSAPMVDRGIALIRQMTSNPYSLVFDPSSRSVVLTVPWGDVVGAAGYTNACITPGGDVIFLSPLVPWNGQSQVGIHRFGITSGITRTYACPAGSNGRYDGLHIVAQNDEQTLWLLQESPTFALYQFDPQNEAWTAVTVDGGFGARTDSPYEGQTHLLHDPVSDAVAVVMPDASGAWIFNATDCMDVPIAPFFFAFDSAPALGDAVFMYPQQLYDGQLTVRYMAGPNFVDGHAFYDCTAALYNIGTLQQIRQQDDIPG